MKRQNRNLFDDRFGVELTKLLASKGHSQHLLINAKRLLQVTPASQRRRWAAEAAVTAELK